jgi:hypothetical protein
MGEWTGLIWLRMGRSEMLFVKKVMELWVPSNCREFLDLLRNC